jgi:hypothetical protein
MTEQLEYEVGNLYYFETSTKAVTVYAMEAYRCSRIEFYSFLTSALDGGEWSTSSRGHFML